MEGMTISFQAHFSSVKKSKDDPYPGLGIVVDSLLKCNVVDSILKAVK